MFQEREERRKVDVPCELAGLGGAAQGRLRDLSNGGCQLLSPHFAFGGERLMISLTFPNPRSEMHIVAETRWSDVDTTPQQYVLGCRFVHSDQSRKIIREILQAIGENQPPGPEPKPEEQSRILR